MAQTRIVEPDDAQSSTQTHLDVAACLRSGCHRRSPVLYEAESQGDHWIRAPRTCNLCAADCRGPYRVARSEGRIRETGVRSADNPSCDPAPRRTRERTARGGSARVSEGVRRSIRKGKLHTQ